MAGVRVLIVEDKQKNRYLMTFLLQSAGYETIEAVTGEDGVEKALQERPDLILMDIQLPGIDGLTTTRKIREAERDRHVPIVALTSYAMTGDREKALLAGCDGYIEKPINPDTILEEIERFLGKSP